MWPRLAAFVACADIEHRDSTLRSYLARYVAGACAESFAIVLFRHLCIIWLLGAIIPYNLSYKTWPFEHWERLDPTPNRPDDMYDYGDGD